MEFDFGILEAKGISTKDGIGFTGGNEKYVSAMQRYFKSYEANKKAVTELLASGDIEGYAIKVHSLKSNSRMIGANELAGAFEELELAAKEGNTAHINEKTRWKAFRSQVRYRPKKQGMLQTGFLRHLMILMTSFRPNLPKSSPDILSG